MKKSNDHVFTSTASQWRTEELIQAYLIVEMICY